MKSSNFQPGIVFIKYSDIVKLPAVSSLFVITKLPLLMAGGGGAGESSLIPLRRNLLCFFVCSLVA
jgi:hypothetical protein